MTHRTASMAAPTASALALLGIPLLLGAEAGAADLNARDFFGAPAGTTLGVLYLPATRAHEFHGPADRNGKAELKTNAMAYRQVFFSDICGTLCTPQFIIPFVDIDARLPGSAGHTGETGFGDPQVGGTLFFINDPERRRYSGLLTLITLPLGEYHAKNPDVSPGANRWGATFVYNYTQGIGRDWVLEANLEAQFYAKNDDYFGSDLEQKPLYRLQAFASYDFSQSTYGALKLVHADGGELKLQGHTLDDTHQRYTQLGFELGHWLDRRNSLMFGLSRNVATDNAFHGSQALLRLVHVFWRRRSHERFRQDPRQRLSGVRQPRAARGHRGVRRDHPDHPDDRPAVAAQLAAQWQLSPARVGDLFSVELGAMSLATLPAFHWLKRVDWRHAALLAGLLFIAANLASALAGSYPLLLALRFCSALAGGSLMILCLSSAASTATPSRVYGLWVMGQLVVGAVGLALLPALFERFGLAACYLLLAGLMGLALPLSRAFPSGSPPAEARASTGAVHSRLRVGLGILAVLTFYISLSGVWTFIGAIAEGAGIGAGASGEVLAVATLMGIAGAACASFIGNRLPRDLMLLGGYLAMAAAILLLIGQPPLARFALAALLFKFTWTFALPFILACLADLDRSGRLMNASNLVIGGGLAIGPALAGRLIEGSGGFLPLLPIAAGLAALSLLLALACRPR